MTTERENVIDFVNPYFDQAALTQSHQPSLWSGSSHATSSTLYFTKPARILFNPYFDQVALTQPCQPSTLIRRLSCNLVTRTLIGLLSHNHYFDNAALAKPCKPVIWPVFSHSISSTRTLTSQLSHNHIKLYFDQAALTQPHQPCTLTGQHSCNLINPGLWQGSTHATSSTRYFDQAVLTQSH